MLEKLVKQIMAECEADGEPVTEAEAREMAEMELKAKKVKNYTQSEEKPKAKPKTEKVRKIDENKLYILTAVNNALAEICDVQATFENEVKLHFTFQNEQYTLNLIKHRPKK